ncbi:MAG TPA: helix-turn-helix domain-containing protein [Pedobacter sp.]|uniref:helix-turn-helix domain-containing protein n=1 Tax=Pedobacter sp. TaxID=1411316 RepID=UPI002CBAED5E|nr:helix-turn-helix domain-containing protein [Pedobacter sp.]HMI01134.1 helix-turn-helix domain-containing protein [Pedobacter sp.]
MNFKVIFPEKHLANYVRFFWFAEGNASINQPYIHNAFAYTYPEFSFCYKGQFHYNCGSGFETTLFPGIYGQTQTFSKVNSKSEFGIFGFYLYAHALPQLFHLPANELTDQAVDTKTLFGKQGEILEEKIMLASGNYERVRIVSGFLEEKLKNARINCTNIISSIMAISNSCPTDSIKSLAENSFLSVRQFERRFKEFTGFRPKLFFRIRRFNSLLNKSFEGKSLAQIAYEYGYYDQSHFIHDFKNFSGYNPGDYFDQKTIAATDRGTVEY